MKTLINLFGQIIILITLGNIILLMIPKFIRTSIKKLTQISYKVVKSITSLVIKQVCELYDMRNKKVSSNKKQSNVIHLKKKVNSK